MHHYNTSNEDVKFKEYGRNVQNLVAYLATVEDPEKRNALAATLVELMRQINPNMHEGNDYSQMIWDHLYLISDFKLEVNSPFPIPEATVLEKKPEPVAYNQRDLRFRHYGRNIELLIDEAIAIEDKEEREKAVIYLGRLMKNFYCVWNKDGVEDDVIYSQIRTLSKNQLEIDMQMVKKEHLFEPLVPMHAYQNTASSQKNKSSGGKGKGKGGRGRSNNKRNDNRRKN